MRTTTAQQLSDTCHSCGAYDLPVEELNGKLWCEDCADEYAATHYR